MTNPSQSNHQSITLQKSPINQKKSQSSWRRLWRQVSFIPILHNRWLTKAVREELTQAVKQTEIGHRGEIFLIIENTLPLSLALHINSRERAINLFGLYRVWDTEENTGVLVYLNICERTLEIVADRGINRQVMPEVWQALCDKAIAGIRQDNHVESLKELLADIGQLLKKYYQLEKDPSGNELSDEIVYLT